MFRIGNKGRMKAKHSQMVQVMETWAVTFSALHRWWETRAQTDVQKKKIIKDIKFSDSELNKHVEILSRHVKVVIICMNAKRRPRAVGGTKDELSDSVHYIRCHLPFQKKGF